MSSVPLLSGMRHSRRRGHSICLSVAAAGRERRSGAFLADNQYPTHGCKCKADTPQPSAGYCASVRHDISRPGFRSSWVPRSQEAASRPVAVAVASPNRTTAASEALLRTLRVHHTIYAERLAALVVRHPLTTTTSEQVNRHAEKEPVVEDCNGPLAWVKRL